MQAPPRRTPEASWRRGRGVRAGRRPCLLAPILTAAPRMSAGRRAHRTGLRREALQSGGLPNGGEAQARAPDSRACAWLHDRRDRGCREGSLATRALRRRPIRSLIGGRLLPRLLHTPTPTTPPSALARGAGRPAPGSDVSPLSSRKFLRVGGGLRGAGSGRTAPRCPRPSSWLSGSLPCAASAGSGRGTLAWVHPTGKALREEEAGRVRFAGRRRG